MIIRDKPGRLELLFAIKGSVVPIIAPRVAFLMLMSAGMVWLHRRADILPEPDEFGFTVFGIALSLFLGFRNNAAYDRWWEARRLWGGLLADLRSLAREAQIFIRNDDLRSAVIRASLSFLNLHRNNLRAAAGEEALHDVDRGRATMTSACEPLNQAAKQIAAGQADFQLDGFGARSLAERLASITSHQAACERIANTPLPFVYSLLIYRTTYIYCLLLPLALVERAGWLTPLFVGIVGYVFLGLAEVSEELSHPFGMTPNAIPLDALYRAAEISLAPHLGEVPPAALEPRDYYLS